jgi:hypothetical protein
LIGCSSVLIERPLDGVATRLRYAQ